ncbi:helix-turn-helix transcriptional regulator [Polyangium sp. 15x6]|uniref:helix-turn-helix transcriptional regulator n=1 Tax=Polyangium sp. 15x6 TaxID=3042687 RepID=UPI00249A0509|nr:helix-turn-helix transcriptional regulator [Polyangium sp. 15x6]MDI3282953.1 helix-turn-helix transcriptional regulator [Polyangium sp. 15x6]
MDSLDAGQWRMIADVVAEVAGRPAEELDDTLAALLDAICEGTHSQRAFVVLASRAAPCEITGTPDPLGGWRPRQVIHHRAPEEHIALSRAYFSQARAYMTDPHTQAVAGTSGSYRAFLRRELVDDRTWERAPQVAELWPALGIADRLMGAASASPRAEVLVCLDRGRGDGRFRETDRDWLAAIIQRTSWFLRRVVWSHGLMTADALLSPRERELVVRLLGKMSEKQIAAELGLTTGTAHQYIVAIYRKLGIQSRAELMAGGSDAPGGAAKAPARPRHGLSFFALRPTRSASTY